MLGQLTSGHSLKLRTPYPGQLRASQEAEKQVKDLDKREAALAAREAGASERDKALAARAAALEASEEQARDASAKAQVGATVQLRLPWGAQCQVAGWDVKKHTSAW